MKQFMRILKQKSYSSAKLRFNSKLKMFAFSILAVVCILITAADMKSGLAMMAAAPIVSLVKFAKKEEDLTDEEKALLGTIEARINTALEEFGEGVISADDFKKAIEDIKKLISEASSSGASEEVEKELKELKKMMKEASSEIQGLKDKGFNFGGGSPLDKALDSLLDSQKFKDFVNGVDKKSGKIELSMKDIVSLGTNYSGATLVSQQNGRVIEYLAERRLNLRDVMMTEQGDPKYPSMTYTEIESLDRGAASVSENGRLPKSSFSIKEKTESTKRIGTYLQISNRLLKSRVYVKSWLLNRLPKWIRLAEDFQIMFGDGQGNNLEGIAKRAVCVSNWIKDNVATGVVGDIATIETYNDGKQVKVIFTKAFDKIGEGMKITIAGAPEENTLNGSHLLHKESDRAVVLDTSFASIGNLTADQIKALTFTIKNNFFNEVESPDLGDAVKAIFSVLTYAEYSPNAIVLNPSTIFEIETAKDTTGRSLGLVSVGANGVKTIAGRPVVESTAIAPGYYFVGDMASAASLVDYTTLTIEFAEDVECKISGYVVAIAQEEVLMPVYNKYAFGYGRLSDVKAAITKA